MRKSQLETIQPIVEFYRINKCPTRREAGWQVFDGGEDANLYAQGLKAELQSSYGIYILYDSRGHALYVGKAREQTIWKEMNLAFNRKRDVQTIALVHHPERNQEFKPGYEKLRQPKDTQLELWKRLESTRVRGSAAPRDDIRATAPARAFPSSHRPRKGRLRVWRNGAG